MVVPVLLPLVLPQVQLQRPLHVAGVFVRLPPVLLVLQEAALTPLGRIPLTLHAVER